MSIITAHRGPWDDNSRQSQALRFIEKYVRAVDSLSRSKIPSHVFYSNMAVYHDTKGEAVIGGSKIWERLSCLLFPFASTRHEPCSIHIVPCDQNPGQQVVYGEFLAHFLLKGDLGEEEILVPKFVVWTLGQAEEGEGQEGLQIQVVRQYYDNAVVGRYVTEKRRREGRKRKFEGE